MRAILPLFLFIVLIVPNAFAKDDLGVHFDVEKLTLSNGLVVLVHENHTMPIVSFHQWFRVGSSHENPNRTGLAHFFEHMMFKGTSKYPNGVIDKLIKQSGGDYNAFTSEDYTGYYSNIPNDKLELIMDIESDRMRNLLFDPKEINSEREVVKEERRMRYENSVPGSLYLLKRQTLYKHNNYRWPVIGSMAHLNATELSEFKEFYNKYYAPNNTVLVVAGDVTVSQVKKLVDKYYGDIKSQVLPPANFTPEPEQKSPREVRVTKDVQNTTFAITYLGPNAKSDDRFALDLLASALGSGDSSRLYKKLVFRDKIATSVYASARSQNIDGEFSIQVSLVPGANLDSAIQTINSELSQMKKNLLPEKELEKLKNQIMLDYITGLKTMRSRAQALASYEIAYGDYSVLFKDLPKYNALKAEDIKAIAEKYIQPAKRGLVVVEPQAAAASTPPTEATAPKPEVTQ